jgi:23S rRNA (adenine2503-C2)-methyltransferase
MTPWSETKRVDSANENVWKYVFSSDNAVAESVLYRYPTFENRTVICCSTQSGCPVGCRFCGAGDFFVRSLTSGEIVAQVDHLLADHTIDASAVARMQIMFMSMGEPLLNQSGLIGALRELSAKYSKAALLISTSGPRVNYEPIRTISCLIPKVGLQFSVHESTDDARNRLIPFRAKLSLAEIAREGKAWADETGRRPFFNYCAHERNSATEDADRLAALFPPETWECTVSVVCERDEHVSAANERQRGLASDFMAKMLDRGFNVRMFDPAGQDDIGGGCGQLWFVQDWMRNNPDKARPSIGCGKPTVHAPRPTEAVAQMN